jgi:4-hydroxythreonine-4-phosphate dehydrogenase
LSGGDSRPVVAITTGEPAGVGPELCGALRAVSERVRCVLIGDAGLIADRCAQAGFELRLQPYGKQPPSARDTLEVVDLALEVPSRAGHLDAANGGYVLRLIDRALAGCLSGEFAAMVTAPVHKGVINDAGIPFTGHTEYLAERTGTERVVMMLAGGGMRVALATTHLALKDVPAAIRPRELEATLRILHREMIAKFRIASPRILVAGLNPHAGEGGYLGREEIDVIAPVLERLRADGMSLVGPLPADTLFTHRQLEQCDCVLAMYHDQGLPVLKYASFGHGVNITLGLPILRTSVDHGTALELAGTGRADAGSLIAATELAFDLAAA